MTTYIYRSTTDSELWLQIRDMNGNVSVMAEPDEYDKYQSIEHGFITLEDAYVYMVEEYGEVELVDTI
jgi:hypothetical protein